MNKSFPHNLAYEIPALSPAAGGTKISNFPRERSVDMNDEMADGWPAERGGVGNKKWLHSDYKDVGYRYTFKLFDHMVDKASLR